jgi:hypothetical protein
MNVSLTVELEKYVRRKVASGLYNNASEVIREALRLHVAREAPLPTKPHPDSPMKDKVLAKLVALEEPLRKQGLISLALFGSVVRSTARPDSDIDVLVDVAPDAKFSLIRTRGRPRPSGRGRIAGTPKASFSVEFSAARYTGG